MVQDSVVYDAYRRVVMSTAQSKTEFPSSNTCCVVLFCLPKQKTSVFAVEEVL